MAYTYRRTGSARSVGRRRTIKYYAASKGAATYVIAARSAAGARMDARMFGVTLTGGYGTPAADGSNVLDRRVSMNPPAPPAQPANPAPPPPPPPAQKKKGGK